MKLSPYILCIYTHIHIYTYIADMGEVIHYVLSKNIGIVT